MNLFKKKEQPKFETNLIAWPPIQYKDVTVDWVDRASETFKECREQWNPNFLLLILPNNEEKIIPLANVEMITMVVVREEKREWMQTPIK